MMSNNLRISGKSLQYNSSSDELFDMSEQADLKMREQRLNNYGKSSIMFLENPKQSKKYIYQIDRKSPEYSTQEMTQTEFQEIYERKKSNEKDSSQKNSKTMFYKLMKNQQSIFSNCLQPSSCVQKTSYCCSVQQAQNQQDEEPSQYVEDTNFWKLPTSCACISNQNKNEECKEIVDKNYKHNQLQLRNFVISPQTNSLRRYFNNTEGDQIARKNGISNVYQEERNTGFFGSKNIIDSKINEEIEFVEQELKECTIDNKGSFENEKIIVQTSSPDMYRKKNQYFDKWVDVQNPRATRQQTNTSSMSMTQYSTSNLHNLDPKQNNIVSSIELGDSQKNLKCIYGSLKKQKLSQTDDENTRAGYTKILTNDFTEKQIEYDPMKDQELYLFNSQYKSINQNVKINVKDLKIDQLLKKNAKTTKNNKLQKYKNIQSKQKVEKQAEYIEQRDSSQLQSYRSARKQRIQQILQNTEQSLEGYNKFQKNLKFSQFFSTGKKSQEFDNLKPETDKIERFSYQLQLPLLNGNQNKKTVRLQHSYNKSEEQDSNRSAITTNINLKINKSEKDNISIIDQEAQKLLISKTSIPFSIAAKSANKDLKLQLKNLESISEKKQKQKKHKIKISKNQKSSLQYNNQILLTNPDELSKSYELAINILSSYSALKSPNEQMNSQQSRKKKSNVNFQYQTVSIPTDCSIYQKVLIQKFQSKRSCSKLLFSIDGFKTSEYNTNTKQISSKRKTEHYNKKDNRKAMSNQKNQINEKNQLINIQELNKKQNRNLNNTQISINNSKVLNTSKMKSNNWNLSYRSLKQNGDVRRVGTKKGAAVIIMNLDEDTQHKHNFLNSSSKKTNSNHFSERKVSASRCEACRSKSNQKGLDVSRADSNILIQRNNESRLEKNSINQINEKQQKDIQISMIKFNQMINEEIEKSRLKIEKNSELLMSTTSNLNIQNVNSSPSMIPQNEAFLASIQHQSPYLTFKQQNDAFFQYDCNQQINQDNNQQPDECQSSNMVKSLISNKNIGNHSEKKIQKNFENFIKQKTTIVKEQILKIQESQTSEVNQLISENDLQNNLNTPVSQNNKELVNHQQPQSVKNSVVDSSTTSQAKYQTQDISKFFYPKPDQIEKQKTQKFENDSESKYLHTDKKQNSNIKLQELNKDYESEQKKKWIDFSESSITVRSVKNPTDVIKNVELSKQLHIFDQEKLAGQNQSSGKSIQTQTVNHQIKMIPKVLSFSQNHLQKEQNMKSISEDSSNDFSNIRLVNNNIKNENSQITMIKHDNFNLEKSLEQNQTINNNKVMDYSSKINSRNQDNTLRQQNRSLSLEQRIKMFQDTLSQKLSVSCKNSKAQNNLVNQKIDLDKHMVLEDKEQTTLNRKSIFDKKDNTDGGGSTFHKIKKHSVIKEQSNEASIRDSIVKNDDPQFRNSVNSNRLIGGIRDSQQSFQLKSLTKSKNDSGNKYMQ